MVITWLNRGTLHLVRSEDYPWLHALTTAPLFTGIARRLSQESVSPSQADRAVGVIERSLAADGPLVRAQLRERIEAGGVRTAGQALVQLLALASLRGLIVRGPMIGREQAHVLVRDWLGPTPKHERDLALAELARRYLSGHGPAGDRDLARWAGLPLRDARAGLSAISSELRERPDGMLDLARRPAAAPLPPPRLLGAFEPLLLGWTSRQPILGAQQAIVTVNGIFRAFALVRARAAATWRMRAGEVEIQPFRRLSKADAGALEADAADVRRFLAA